MSRKKKVKDALVKRAKKANDKLKPHNKPRYISKAERAKLELEEQEAGTDVGQPDEQVD